MRGAPDAAAASKLLLTLNPAPIFPFQLLVQYPPPPTNVSLI